MASMLSSWQKLGHGWIQTNYAPTVGSIARIVIQTKIPTPAPNKAFQPFCLGNPHEMVGVLDDNLQAGQAAICVERRRRSEPLIENAGSQSPADFAP